MAARLRFAQGAVGGKAEMQRVQDSNDPIVHDHLAGCQARVRRDVTHSGFEFALVRREPVIGTRPARAGPVKLRARDRASSALGSLRQ